MIIVDIPALGSIHSHSDLGTSLDCQVLPSSSIEYPLSSVSQTSPVMSVKKTRSRINATDPDLDTKAPISQVPRFP
jgi:hypothetical protein